MADGTNYAKAIAGSPSDRNEAEWNGRLRVQHDTYTFASAAIATTVNVGWLDPGEVFIDGFIHGADIGSATTLQLGDASDDDRYLAATVFTTANQVTRCNKAEGIGYKNTTAVRIPLVVKTGTEEATGAIEVVIFKAGR